MPPPTAALARDPQTGKRYVVVTQRADFRPTPTPTFHGVARFTEKKYSPSEAGYLLRTPTHYRNSKDADGDHMDAAQPADLRPMVMNHLRNSGFSVSQNHLTADGRVVSSKEPWIHCTSIRPTHAVGAASLERQFSRKGPDAVVTTVDAPDGFAKQLGIAVALSPRLRSAVKDDGCDVIKRDHWRLALGVDIDTVVYVIHGPVHYYNATLTIRSGNDFANAETYRLWFTKRTTYSGEREYRFAVFAGGPTTDTFSLDVTPALCRLTRSWRFGDTWWHS